MKWGIFVRTKTAVRVHSYGKCVYMTQKLFRPHLEIITKLVTFTLDVSTVRGVHLFRTLKSSA